MIVCQVWYTNHPVEISSVRPKYPCVETKVPSFYKYNWKKIYALILNCRLSCVIGFRSVYFSPFCVCFWEKKNQAHLFLTGAVVSITLILSDQMFVKFCLQKALLSNTIRWSKKTQKTSKTCRFQLKKTFPGRAVTLFLYDRRFYSFRRMEITMGEGEVPSSFDWQTWQPKYPVASASSAKACTVLNPFHLEEIGISHANN